jgi:type IV secretion system protein VirD4
MKQEVKKLLILNLPYLLFVYLFDKIGAAIRLSLSEEDSSIEFTSFPRGVEDGS